MFIFNTCIALSKINIDLFVVVVVNIDLYKARKTRTHVKHVST